MLKEYLLLMRDSSQPDRRALVNKSLSPETQASTGLSSRRAWTKE